MTAASMRGNGRGNRRREDREMPVVPVDPSAPHSLVVQAQNREACNAMLAEARANIKKRNGRIADLKTKLLEQKE